MPFRHSKHPKHDQNGKNNRKIPNFLPDVHELASWRWKRGRKTPLIKPYLITYQWGKDEERRRQYQSLMSSCKKALAHENAISNVRCHFVIQNTPNVTKIERITEKYLLFYPLQCTWETQDSHTPNWSTEKERNSTILVSLFFTSSSFF
mgnify:CR=1 FL=1